MIQLQMEKEPNNVVLKLKATQTYLDFHEFAIAEKLFNEMYHSGETLSHVNIKMLQEVKKHMLITKE